MHRSIKSSSFAVALAAAAFFTTSAAFADTTDAAPASEPAAEPAPARVSAVPTFAAPAPIASDTPAPLTLTRPSSSSSREDFRVGALAGVGFPHPLAIEGFVKIHRVVGIGAEYSLLPSMNLAGADVSFKAAAVDLRIFPFKGSLFIGCRAGRQWLAAKTTVSAGALGSSTESMEAATWFINPRVGILHTMSNGVTVGVDVGVQLPIDPSYTRSGALASSGLGSGVEHTLASAAATLGNKPTPTVDLLRVGFLF